MTAIENVIRRIKKDSAAEYSYEQVIEMLEDELEFEQEQLKKQFDKGVETTLYNQKHK
jgi:glucose-6-phosphate-specific signal transduction histidine kinase